MTLYGGFDPRATFESRAYLGAMFWRERLAFVDVAQVLTFLVGQVVWCLQPCVE